LHAILFLTIKTCLCSVCSYEFRMNVKTGEVRQKELSTLLVDFPRVNEEYTGRYT
jgi:carotenoid cleavage dioxygenase-like enzyme